jgi:ribonuclease R
VEVFEEFLSTLGYSLSRTADAPEPRDFQKLVASIAGKPEERPIAFLMLRTMQKARYAPDNLGHFGLAADHYTHFTSPIRRYPDLVVHRSLRESRRGMSAERQAELAEDLPDVARHTSERERRANDAERELVQWKKVRFMTDKVGDVFNGYITGVSAFGLFIELVEHFVEGMVHVSTVADDYYRFVERAHVLRGEKSGRVYRLGDRVEVQVIRVDLERRQIDLGLMEILDAVRRSDRSRGGRKAAHRPAAKPEERGRPRKKRPGRRERSTRRRGR